MKKRIISLLLVVCMAVALFAGLGINAYADETAETTAYTIKKGDTLWGLCNKQGINYYTCKNAIMSLNSFTSEYQLTHLSVGDTITIPTSDAAGQKLAGSGSTTTATTTVISGSTSTTTTTTTNALANGDVVSYYLIAHTMISGETVMGIYNAWGLNYRNYSDQILAVNSLTGFNKMYAGKTYLLPCPTIPAGSTAGYSIIAHKVVGGDSAYNLCRSYNTNYNNVSAVIKATNGGSNLTTIKSGQIVYIPATGAVSVAASGGTGSAGGTGSTGGTSGVISSTKYDLTKATAKNGSFVLKSGGAEVSSVGAGASVSIVPTPAYNYVVDSIVVSKASDSSTTVATNSSVFTMPAYAVKVTVTFKLGSTTNSGAAHAINVTSAGGTVTSYVDGKEVTSAKAGSFVTLKIKPNKTYEFGSVQVSYGTYSTSVPVSASNSYKPDAEGYITASFNMPDADTKVVAAYTAMTAYNIDRVATNSNGEFYVTVDGVRTDKAVKGQTVAIVSSPNAGCAMSSINVTYKNGSAVSMIDALTFIMPAQDVRIVIYYEAASAIKSSTSNGSLTYKVNGVAVDRAVKGTEVEIIATPYSGYILNSLYVNNVETTFTADNKAIFTMPEGDVTVKATFKAVETYKLTWKYSEDKVEGCSIKFMVNGGYVTSAAKDTLVTVVPVCKDGYKLDELTGVTFEDGSEDTFKMGGSAATVTAKFVEVDKTTVTVNYDSTYFNAPTLLVDGKTMTVTPSGTAPDMTASFKVYPGKNAVLQTSCKEGYALEKATATNTTISDSDVFKVGENDITITLAERGQYRSITSGATINGSFTMKSSDGPVITNTAATGSKVFILPVPNKGYEVDSITETHLVNGEPKTTPITPNTTSGYYIFTMPGADVTLDVKFKPMNRTVEKLSIDETMGTPEGFKLKLSINDEEPCAIATDGADASNISVPASAKVTLSPVLSLGGYSVVSVVITDKDGNNIIDKINYSADETSNRYTFTMPVDYNNIKITVTVSPDAPAVEK